MSCARSFVAIVAGACIASVALGCASSGKTDTQKQASALREDLEKCTAALASLEAEMKKTLAAHEAIVSGADGDYIGHFKTFNKGIDRIEKSTATARSRYDAVNAAADQYFASWTLGAQQIEDDSLRKKSERHLKDLRKEFEEIWEEASDAKKKYDELMTTLTTHRQYWSNSLNETTAKELGKDRRKIQGAAEKVYGAIEEATAAAKEFNDSIAMRKEIEPPAEPAQP